MSNMRNHVQLIGHLGADPEIKEFNEGKKLARISMATNESYRKQSGERVNDTQWHNVVAWGPQAEFLEKHVQKGQGLVVNGKLSSRSYEKDGEKRYSTEIVANEFFLTGPKE
jgi:single-strand DNA-binding protein